MQLRCKCGYFENITIHKDGLEVAKFTCGTCKRNALKPLMLSVVVSSVRVMIFKRANMEGKPDEMLGVRRQRRG